MTILMIGLFLFAAPHFHSMLFPAARDGMKARLGESAYKGLFSLVSLLGVGLVVYGYSRAWASGSGIEPVFAPPAWGRHLAMLLVLVAFILIAASHGKGHIKALVKHPMSLGIALWALAHLLANGRVLDLWMFGTFLVIALLDVVLSTLRGKAPMHVPQVRSDIIAVVAGIAIYALFLFGFHPYILGLPVVQ